MKRIICVAAIALGVMALPVHGQIGRLSAADRLIAKAVKAMGGLDAYRARSSFISRGIHYEGAYRQEYLKAGSGAAIMTRMRPNRRVVGCVVGIPGCDGKWGRNVEGYDGSDAWELDWEKQRLIHAVNKARSAIICGAQFDPLFVDYKRRGFKARYLGAQTLLGRKMLGVRIDNPGCPSESFYFDPKTYRLAMQRVSLPVHARGDAVDTIRVLSDLRPVAGVLMPFRSDEFALADGHSIFGEVWTSIEANVRIDASVFAAPKVAPTGATALVLQMLDAAKREKPDRLLAIYDAYRATPEGKAADTADDMNWLGYELLKVDNYPAALAVFNRVVAEHPDSANAYDSLGDGYLQRGDQVQALAAFERALALDPKLEDTRRKRDLLKGS